jgi:modification methylase
MGSGTTAVVAAGLGRDFIGIEKSAKYCESAMARLEKNKIYPEVAKFHQLDLFQLTPPPIKQKKTKQINDHDTQSLF